MLPKPTRFFLLHTSISILVAAFVLLLTQDFLLEFPPLKRAELSLIDLRFQQRGPVTETGKTSKIIIVEISQESFRSLPAKWPWPRSYFTRLVKNLKRAGAKTIGIDIIFTSSDSSSEDREFRDEVKDAANVALAGKIEIEPQRVALHESSVNYGNSFLDSVSNIGIVNTVEDADGILRRYMPLVYDNNQRKRLPTFSMAVLNLYFNKEPSYTSEVTTDYFRYGNKVIPTYNPTSFLINYYGSSNTFRRIRFADVIDDKDFQTMEELNHPGEEINTFDDPDFGYLYDGTFKDKIVLVGSTMPEDKDLFSTPMAQGKQEGDNKMYGVEVHANVIQSILDNNFIIRQPLWMTVFVVFGLTLFTFVFTAGLKSIRTKYSAFIELLGIALIMAEMFIVYWASVKLFVEKNFLADMTSAFFAIIVSYVGSTIYSYVSERKQKILIKSMFSRYVNPSVVDELVAHPEKLRLGGERKELTVFFSDIENFTLISEKMSPEALVNILNEYLSKMTALILNNNGTLDKYEGDAIVAFWGAPIPQLDHAFRACRTAVQMQLELMELNERWRADGKPVLRTRIGISTGDMIVGNMGGINRFDYTVIGDSVNLGARLEGANKQFKTSIMISENTYKHVEGSVYARELDLIVVAGKTEPIRVFELIGTLNDSITKVQEQFLEIYSKALKLYRQRKWDVAIETFEKAIHLFPDDYPTRVHIERAKLYRVSPPPLDWSGGFVLPKK